MEQGYVYVFMRCCQNLRNIQLKQIGQKMVDCATPNIEIFTELLKCLYSVAVCTLININLVIKTFSLLCELVVVGTWY